VSALPIERHPSPNHGPRPHDASIDMLVLHYTGMRTGAEALARLCDPAEQVSAHYLVEEDGRVLSLVPEDRRAWHAGLSCWRGVRDVNSRSIGIELVHPGHAWGYRPFRDRQVTAVVALCQAIVARYPMPACNVVGHSDVSPNRKEDPGEAFPWSLLAAHGVGLMPKSASPAFPAAPPPLSAVQEALASYGYEVGVTGSFDLATRNAVLAFQRHFRPECLDGQFDRDCAARLGDLLRQAGCAVPPGFLP
jgi:N-acetylmuramoyl-L-alanine amidase